jgi:hypothetical protein
MRRVVPRRERNAGICLDLGESHAAFSLRLSGFPLEHLSHPKKLVRDVCERPDETKNTRCR